MILSRALLAPFVTLMLVCGLLVYYFASYSRSQVRSRLLSVVSNHQRLIDQFFQERTWDLRFAADTNDLDSLCRQGALKRLLENLQAGSQAFFDLGVFDDKGNHLAYVGPYDLVGKNYAQTEWFQAVRVKGIYLSDVFLGYRKLPHFILAVRRTEGDRTWYLRATIDTLYFNELVESISIGATGQAYLVNRQGVLQTSRRQGPRLMETDPDAGAYLLGEQGAARLSTGPVQDRKYFYAAEPLEHIDWVLVVRQDVGDAYAPLSHAVLVAVGVIVAGGAAAVVMAYLLASWLSHQLSKADMEKRELKTQLIIAGKLAEVGEMSAGLAHEINNPLQVMQSEQTMITDVLGDIQQNQSCSDAEGLRLIADSVDQIKIQIDRCRKITQGLLRFARKSKTSLHELSIQDFVSELVDMIRPRVQTENIRISQEVDPSLPALASDPDQLQQVFLNLLNNSIHAIREKDGGAGEIRITAARDGDAFVAVSVADDGCGIPPGNMERIFLPFFTTKPVGQGTGLGLSTSYGIIEGLGGQMTVTSELNAGTVFTVRLPLARAERQDDPAARR
ncbi:MAG: two-component sensor histidine kinase [Phycisphaerae bacterium]|nr:two-component sensor histidine kinase [Phycisphaerae bacterium]